jgi:hypothetical protein
VGGAAGQRVAPRAGHVFLVFAERKKVIIFPQNAFDVLGIRTPDCRCKSGYMYHSATGAVYVLKKKLMYLYLFDMIPDIRYDIRYDISIVLVLESTEARRSRNFLQTLFSCFLEIT